MNVLILGGGGREHALAAALAKSPSLSRLFVAPGNPGCAALAENVALPIDDHAAIVEFCRAREIGLVVVGPEAPLVAGVVDDLAAAGILCFGPSKAAARLEGSKGFAKDFCREFGIPTGDYRRFADAASALAYLRAKGAPIVVKADGLAAGKGVVVATTLDEAEQAIQSMFAGAFGGAGAEVVVEDYLDGEELSFFALCDGTRAVPFGGAQDHKRVGDGDAGPNTGGMGAYSPPPLLTPALSEQVMREIVAPTVAGMAKRGAPFRGVLFVGLMVGAGGPKLIEFNVRFGEERQLFAVEIVLDHELRAGPAEGAGEHRLDRLLSFVESHCDDDPFAGGEAVGLDDDRRALGADVSKRRGRVGEAMIVASRNGELAAEVLGESFRAFEARGRFARPEAQDARSGEIVDGAGDQRRLGTDDNQPDFARTTEVDDRRVIVDRQRDVFGHCGATRIARRDKEPRQRRRFRQRHRQSMLAAAAAKNENVHRLSLPILSRLLGAPAICGGLSNSAPRGQTRISARRLSQASTPAPPSEGSAAASRR